MKLKNNQLTYLTLFSGAGIGCYGFKIEGFNCIASVEILEKRIKFQKYNDICAYETGYIADDLQKEYTKERINEELSKWNADKYLDVLIATPPCQGMSVANHKKGDELKRNSLVVESISITKNILPKFFVFENVRGFLNTICTDLDGNDKRIKEAIEVNLAGNYHINYEIINFKDYGCNSSRTRTLVIGTRKDLKEITPFNIRPKLQKEKNLKEIIGNLPRLKEMGSICNDDIYHNYRNFNKEMLNWISDIAQGQSAFNNVDSRKIPHKVVDGLLVYNVNKNGDKYKRQFWDKVAPCIHTRNDILASQNTIHPEDNRVFSIREIMLMMNVPSTFKWSSIEFNKLNSLNLEEKRKFLSKEELNIRHSLGEGVPTIIFQQIAENIKHYLLNGEIPDQKVNKIITQYSLFEFDKLDAFLKDANNYSYPTLSKIAELSNSARNENAAYYTRQDICFSIIKDLPDARNYKKLRILEPSIGVGNFLPLIFDKYKTVEEVIIDLVDIDENSIRTLKNLLNYIDIPQNIKINFIQSDFLKYNFEYKYDIVIGNPPFKKISNDLPLLKIYKENVYNKETNNVFSFFLEKAIKLSNYVALILPKSLINSPEFNLTRELINKYRVQKIIDYGEKGFRGVKIETVSLIINTSKKPKDNLVEIESYITNEIRIKRQDYIFPNDYPYWLIYRNDFFDSVASKIEFDIFKSYRDRHITKKLTKISGKYRVLKSRNIASNEIINVAKYDTYIDDIENLNVSKFLNTKNAVLVPNLTYYPRACFLPKNTIVDGSVAILTLKNGTRKLLKRDLEYYGSDEFKKFYAIARNYGTRSLNIDNNSVFFFGILKD